MRVPRLGERHGWLTLNVLVSLAIAMFLLGPRTVSDCTNTIFGASGDSTAGYIWLQWNYDILSGPPFRTTTPMIGFPTGGPLWQPFYITSIVLMLPIFLVTHVVGPVCSWNIAVHAAFLLNGVVMFLFVRWLTRRPTVAIVAGVVFELLPFHLQKAYGHLAYVHTWVFVLLLWSFMVLSLKQTRKAAAVAGAAVALAAYTDGYYLLLGGVFAASLGIATLFPSHPAAIRQRLLNLGIAATVAGVLLSPVALTLVTSRQDIGAVVDRTSIEAKVYSARPWEYVLPARHHPVFSEFLGAWQDRHLHESNYSEQTLYLGAPVLVAAIAAVVVAFASRRRRDGDERDRRARHGVVLAALSVVAAAVFSAPPQVGIGSITLPFPSGFVVEALPFWRVFARFFIPLSVAMVTLAAIGLARATASQNPLRRTLIPLLVIPIVVFDFLPPETRDTFSYDRETPPVYDWLDRLPPDAAVAEYPMDPPGYPNHLHYLSYQRTHQHPLVNGAPHGTRAGRLRSALSGLGDPQTVPALRTLGARWVVVHEDAFDYPVDRSQLPPSLVRRFSSRLGDLYEIQGPGTPAAVATGRGFHERTNEGFRSFRWMRSQGTLEFHRLSRDVRTVQVTFDAISFGKPRHLTVRQLGRVVWSGEVPANERIPVTIEARTDAPLALSASPGAVPIESLLPDTRDDREVTVNIGAFAVNDTLGSPSNNG